MQGLVVMPIFAGFDHDKGRGRIYKFDITGGRFREADYYSTGSGGKDARASLKKILRHEELSRTEVIEAAVEALLDAADEDRATGGIDVARGIFPTVKIATQNRVEDVSDDELRRVYDGIVARRQGNGGAPPSTPRPSSGTRTRPSTRATASAAASRSWRSSTRTAS